MQYYVIGPDGNKYGPADVPTLKQWVAENRLNPDSMLEDFGTGQRVQASAVAGLFGDQPTATAQPGPTMGPAGSPYSQPPTPGTVYNPHAQGAYDNGSSELTLAWVFGALALLCCGPFCIGGIIKANQAEAKGNPGAKAAKIFNIVAAVLWVLAIVFQFVIIGAMGLGAAGSTAGSPFGP